MVDLRSRIEIPVTIVKESFESRERKYKCNTCHEILDRLFQYEDHWLSHAVNGGKPNEIQSLQIESKPEHVGFIRISNGEITNATGTVESKVTNKQGKRKGKHSKKTKHKSAKVSKNVQQPVTTDDVVISSTNSINLNTIDLRSLTANLIEGDTVIEESIVENNEEIRDGPYFTGEFVENEIIESDDDNNGNDDEDDDAANNAGDNDDGDVEEDDDDGGEHAAKLMEISVQLQNIIRVALKNMKRKDYPECLATEAMKGNSSQNPASTREGVLTLDDGLLTDANDKEIAEESPENLDEMEALELSGDLVKKRRYLACQICGREFNRKEYLRKHLQRHRLVLKRNSKTNCIICFQRCGSGWTLKRHYKTVHSRDWFAPEGPVICNICSKRFHDEAALLNHMDNDHIAERKGKRRVTGNGLVVRAEGDASERLETQCQFCNELFNSKAKFQKHLRQAHGQPDTNTVCSLCGRAFSSRFLLLKHSVLHKAACKDGEPWDDEKEGRTCPSCRLEFPTVEELHSHECKIEPNQCHLCRRRISRPYSMKSHLIGHVKTKNRYKCSICKYETHRLNFYTNHIAEHSSHPRPFACDQCSFRCKLFSSLKKHQRVHDKRFEYTCPECGEILVKTYSILNHMRNKHGITEVERPYSCDKCTMRCYSKGALEEHAKTHASQEAIKCKDCHETFTNKRLAQLHRIKVHLGKDYQCKTCGTDHTSQLQLDMHIESHANRDAMCVCEFCNEGFTSINSLGLHIHKHADKVGQCAVCCLNVAYEKLPFHKLAHLQPSSCVNKACKLCGEVLDTVECVYQHSLEHHGATDATPYFAFPTDIVKDSFPVDKLPDFWACSICSKTLNEEASWFKHVQIHDFSPGKAETCKLCKGLFFDKEMFVKHANNCVKRTRDIDAGVIGAVAKNKKSVPKKAGLRSAAKEDSAQQDSAPQEHNESTPNVSENGEESIVPEPNPPFLPITCTLCFQMFDCADGLAYHLLTTCEEMLKDDRCWRCHKSFATERKLNKHVREQKNPCSIKEPKELALRRNVVPCWCCNKKFFGESFLNSHFAKYHDVGSHKCLKCLKEFDVRIQLEKHIFEHAIEDQLSNFCTACGAIFDGLFELHEHMLTHKIDFKRTTGTSVIAKPIADT